MNKHTQRIILSWISVFAVSATLTPLLLFADFTDTWRCFLNLEKSLLVGLLMSVIHMILFTLVYIPIALASYKMKELSQWFILNPYMVITAFISSVFLLTAMDTPEKYALEVSAFIALYFGLISGTICSVMMKEKTKLVEIANT